MALADFVRVAKQTIKKTVLGGASLIIGLSSLAVAAPLFLNQTAYAVGPSVAPAPSPCATTGTSFLTVTQHIQNDPDSGDYGNWALDTFTETVNVWVGSDHSTYCASATTSNGTFVTTGPASPQTGQPLAAGISGTFTGGENYILPLTLSPSYNTSSHTTVALADNICASNSCANGAFSNWIGSVFTDATAPYADYTETYALTYITPSNGTWTDADPTSLGSYPTGDIGSIENTTTNTAYGTIQAAINAASPGDTVGVAPGLYNENLIINKALTLVGPNSGVAGNGSRASEATVAGGDGFTISLESPNVTIDGFTIKANSDGEGIYNIDADNSSHDISGVTITNNIFSGSSRAIALESNASGTVKVNDNEFDSNDKDLAVADNSFGDLQIEGNIFNEPATNDTGVQIGPDGSGTISSLEFEDNQAAGNVNIGADVSSATVSRNVFSAGSISGGDVEFQAALHNSSTLSDNSFDGSNSYACLQLFGSQYGLDPSNGVTISGNNLTNCGNAASPYYNYGFQISQAVSNVTFSGNTIDNAYDSISTRAGGAFGSGISITGNTVTNSRHLAVNNSVGGTLNVAYNWWGSATASTVASMMSSGVTYQPFYTNSAMTTRSDAKVLPDSNGNATANNTHPTVLVTSNSTPITVTVSSGTSDAAIDYSALKTSNTQAIVPQTTIQTQNATVQIQSGTTITASGSWNGVLTAPTVQSAASVSIPTPSGTVATIGTVIEVGSSSVSLTFDKAVRLLIPGQAGMLVGFERNGDFTQITTVCAADSQAAGNTLPAGGDCYISVGSNMVVWTKHFTTFVTYSKSNTYVVQPGDTMSGIATKLGLSLSQLEALNPGAGHPAGNFNLILPGDVLKIGNAALLTSESTTSNGGQIGSAISTTNNGKVKAAQTSSSQNSPSKNNTYVANTSGAAKAVVKGLQWYWWLIIAAAALFIVSTSAFFGRGRIRSGK